MLIKKEQTLKGKRIGIMGKGGSGKSTVTVLLAKSLKKFGYDVCVLDADPTNMGLAQTLGIKQPPASLLDYFGDMVFNDGSFVYPTGHSLPLVEADLHIEDLPEMYHGRSPDGIDLFIAGKIAELGIGADFVGPIAKIAHEFNPRYPGEAPVTLVDFKAGLEDAVSGDIMSLDWIVVVIDATMASVKMAVDIQEIMNQLKAGEMPFITCLDDELSCQLAQDAKVPGVVFVLNKIQDELTEQFLRDKLAENGIEPLGVINDTLAVAMAGLMGGSLIKTPAQLEADWIVKELETAVSHPPLYPSPMPLFKNVNYNQRLVDQHSFNAPRTRLRKVVPATASNC